MASNHGKNGIGKTQKEKNRIEKTKKEKTGKSKTKGKGFFSKEKLVYKEIYV